ncbi:very long chain fatty acid elongase 4-like isoform X2 [Periplaneta americana]
MRLPVMVSIIALYLYFVLVKGPRFMAHRKPFSLQPILVAYNSFMVLYSIFLVIYPFFNGHMKYLYEGGYCHPKVRTPSEYLLLRESSYGWWYLISKIVELSDTVFFVLRKKENQITFLHVYHHSSTAIYVWFYLTYLPGSQGLVIAFLNSLVHVFMYSYYMIAAMGPRFHRYLWWKKYITWIQLVQFSLMLSCMVGLLAWNCDQPKFVSVYFIFISCAYLLLFSNFYRKTYTKKVQDRTNARKFER